MSKTQSVFTKANSEELKNLLLEAAAKGKPAAHKEEKPAPQQCNHEVHNAIVLIGRAEEAASKADGKRYPAFAAMLKLALPLMQDAGQWAAIVIDLHSALKARNLPAVGVQLVGVVNNARHIAYGKAATRDKGAEVAQGLDVVYTAIDAATSVKSLKAALAAVKTEKHARQGVAKTAPAKAAKAAPSAPTKAEDMQIPATRKEALNAACRILAFVSSTFLAAGTDADLISEVEEVIDALKAKAA